MQTVFPNHSILSNESPSVVSSSPRFLNIYFPIGPMPQYLRWPERVVLLEEVKSVCYVRTDLKKPPKWGG